ncbi:hypothetical protein [Clostridioides sp. ZZV14-6044]|uniref:hypothetical protein n=1 Tax=unclassified Clostridioides TaxID=2635829 RepID=UPI001D115729|nr:hypothetical protein [Clostridioides sp. ZZV14-6104]MCC0744604.1 hypothetical protein [Clostridioides sp. ZZV14-6044]
MIKIEFENSKEIKEFVEEFRVVETSNNDIVCFGEVESLDSCTEENAKHALDIIKNHKHSDRKEKAYKTYLGLENADIEEIYKIHYGDKTNSETVASCEEISSVKLDEKYCNHDNVSKGKDTSDSECTCFICSKKIENKEDVFKMPFLTRDYLSSKKEIKNIEICEKCLDDNSWSVIRRKHLKKMKK